MYVAELDQRSRTYWKGPRRRIDADVLDYVRRVLDLDDADCRYPRSMRRSAAPGSTATGKELERDGETRGVGGGRSRDPCVCCS